MEILNVKLYILVLDALWREVGGLEILGGFQATLTGCWDPGGFRQAAGGLTWCGSFLCAAPAPRL